MAGPQVRADEHGGAVDPAAAVDSGVAAEPAVIVYLGPSMPVADARRMFEADYRPPVRRGDLDGIPSGSVVAIIDGVFEQHLSVSPAEIRAAIARGVRIFGGSSMGALRAAEVPEMSGVGRIYQWYRDGVITRDDEVALIFDPGSGRALTVPTVNVRFAVERLTSLGTIDRDTGLALVAAAQRLSFKDRLYPTILERAKLSGRGDGEDLLAMLRAHDLKRLDAQAVLEAVDLHLSELRSSPEAAPSAAPLAGTDPPSELPGHQRALIWESGDVATEAELLDFLIVTGKLERHLRSMLARNGLARDGEDPPLEPASVDPQQVFVAEVRRWGWVSTEEARVTFADIGLDQESLGDQCAAEAEFRARALALARDRSPGFHVALRGELFIADMALKRETMRHGSLGFFAERARRPPSPAEIEESRAVLCKANDQPHFEAVRRSWRQMGLADARAQDEAVDRLARARQAGRILADEMKGLRPGPAPTAGGAPGMELEECRKPQGEQRFCLPVAEAERHSRGIADRIGITRIGMIGELGEFDEADGVQVAQAARPGNAWSSSYGSGKSRTRAGAIVGSVMEETEKWAQEQFKPEIAMSGACYAELRDKAGIVDPSSLDLPWDSPYHDRIRLDWHRCGDLLAGSDAYIPVDPLLIERRKHDICFTRRGARKHLATNGLGCGFSREEAVLHGLCEYVERHAQRIAELHLANPGGLGEPPYAFIDLSSANPAVADLAARLQRKADAVRVLDITSDIAIPTFVASIVRDRQRADGYGTHPDPMTAIEMALLEAAQTIASATAGGREDLSIRARSLGRHERPRPISVAESWFWLDPDSVFRKAGELEGLASDDVRADILWCLDRISAAGLRQVLAIDLTQPAIAPAHVVRIIVPGLETNNPFYTGPRARLVLLRDLLPRWR